MEGEPEQRSADEIRQKRIEQELALLDKLDKRLYVYQAKQTEQGLSLFIRMSRMALGTEVAGLDPALKTFDFEILLPIKYPFIDPQIMCHTSFSHVFLSLNDGRDLFNEVVGSEGWRVGFKIFTLI